MSRHREKTGKEEGDKAYVVYLALTTRGVDFQAGGAWVELDDGKRLDLEAHVQAGDLVVYRGDRYHGVANVDPTAAPTIDRLCGRMMVTTVVKYFPA